MLDSLYGLFLSIKITDVLDIAIVAFLIYKIFGFIKETRAQQLFRGVLLIVAIFVMSELLNLSLLNWLLTRLPAPAPQGSGQTAAAGLTAG